MQKVITAYKILKGRDGHLYEKRFYTAYAEDKDQAKKYLATVKELFQKSLSEELNLDGFIDLGAVSFQDVLKDFDGPRYLEVDYINALCVKAYLVIQESGGGSPGNRKPFPNPKKKPKVADEPPLSAIPFPIKKAA